VRKDETFIIDQQFAKFIEQTDKASVNNKKGSINTKTELVEILAYFLLGKFNSTLNLKH